MFIPITLFPVEFVVFFPVLRDEKWLKICVVEALFLVGGASPKRNSTLHPVRSKAEPHLSIAIHSALLFLDCAYSISLRKAEPFLGWQAASVSMKPFSIFGILQNCAFGRRGRRPSIAP
jgi:hypothetical protein